MNRIVCVSIFALLLSTLSAPAFAQSSDELVRSLQPSKTKMRGFNSGAENPVATKDRAFIDGLRGKTRAIVVEERKKIIEVVEKNDLPSVDILIFFDFNSATIAPGSVKSVVALGQALSDVRLKGGNFLIGGHTDARGSDAYNQALSERRALSVKAYLVENFHLDPHTLIVAGFGEEKLKNTHDPEADENRRVQVVNLGSAKTARN